MRAAPSERLPFPLGIGVYGAGEIVHLAGSSPFGLVTAGAGISAAVYGATVKRTRDEAVAAKVAALPMVTTAWLAAAAELGVTGPLGWAYLGLFGTTYGVYRLDGATRDRIAWRRERAEWHRIAGWLGLRGSHLLAKEPTRLGERLIINVKGTGKRASAIVASDLGERVAEQFGLRASRVKVREGNIAGRVVISIRFKDPWAHTIPHPLFDDEPEIVLPQVADVCEPLVIGMDPESGRPLTVALWTPDGGQNSMVVSMKRGGKTVLLNNLLERTTAAYNACPMGVSVAKGKVIRRWAPALDLAAYGRDQRVRALRILETCCKIIDYRETMSETPTLRPDRDHPLVPVFVDEMSALLGTQDQIGYAAREAMSYINSKGGSEGVVSVIAGQRGTQSHVGDTDIRTQVDNLIMGKLSRQTEMSHVAGELGFELPNMARHGEGHAGVWLVATVDGDFGTGRTFFLDDFDQIEDLADDEDRRPTPLEPGLIEHLGDAYTRLKYGDDALTVTLQSPKPPQAGPPPAGWMDQLDTDLEAGLPEDLRQAMNDTADKLRQAAEDLAAAPELPEPSPEMVEKLNESAAQRHDQEAQQTKIPDEARQVIIGMLADGTTTGKV
ncbi:MAG TPA: hypothetical protein VKA30_11065, partial [Actinomycetota bacterium]|nr:hypothetical protein [Actinomycetota bacterium]